MDLFTQEVMAESDVFRAFVVYWIFAESNSTLIVVQDGNGIVDVDAKI